jgi:hypothetical protein
MTQYGPLIGRGIDGGAHGKTHIFAGGAAVRRKRRFEPDGPIDDLFGVRTKDAVKYF